MNHFYLIDKPLGITSFDVIRKLKKVLGTSKIGHAGTLDPLASGLLLIATGEYTKLLGSIILHDKEYEFTLCLDGESDSYDTGTPIRYISEERQKEVEKQITFSDIDSLISSSFTGRIMQIPPKYSALKIDGEKALFKAKAGEEFEIAAREVEVFSFDILDFSYPKLVCKAHVSSGTYIRSFAHDIGKKLGTGGYITTLRRTKLGNISVESAQILETFSPEKYTDPKDIFSLESFIEVSEGIIERLQLGQRIKMEGSFKQNTPLFITKNHAIILICHYDGNILSPVRKLHT